MPRGEWVGVEGDGAGSEAGTSGSGGGGGGPRLPPGVDRELERLHGSMGSAGGMSTARASEGSREDSRGGAGGSGKPRLLDHRHRPMRAYKPPAPLLVFTSGLADSYKMFTQVRACACVRVPHVSCWIHNTAHATRVCACRVRTHAGAGAHRQRHCCLLQVNEARQVKEELWAAEKQLTPLALRRREKFGTTGVN